MARKCGHCGCEDVDIVDVPDFKKWAAECADCGARGPMRDTVQEAASAWRESEKLELGDQLTPFVEKLKEYLETNLLYWEAERDYWKDSQDLQGRDIFSMYRGRVEECSAISKYVEELVASMEKEDEETPPPPPLQGGWARVQPLMGQVAEQVAPPDEDVWLDDEDELQNEGAGV